MTREEAIRQLDGADIAVLNRDFFKFNQAIIMAISDLRQQDQSPDSEKMMQREPMTNADRIRAMSDEELAVWLVKKTGYQESAFSSPSYLNFLTDDDDTKEGAIKGTVEWLKKPTEGE